MAFRDAARSAPRRSSPPCATATTRRLRYRHNPTRFSIAGCSSTRRLPSRTERRPWQALLKLGADRRLRTRISRRLQAGPSRANSRRWWGELWAERVICNPQLQQRTEYRLGAISNSSASSCSTSSSGSSTATASSSSMHAGRSSLGGGQGRRGWPSPSPPGEYNSGHNGRTCCYASAFALIASNSAWVIVPLSATASARFRRRPTEPRPARFTHVVVELLPSAAPVDPALIHTVVVDDQVDQHADPRNDHDEDDPRGLGPAREVVTAEDVDQHLVMLIQMKITR